MRVISSKTSAHISLASSFPIAAEIRRIHGNSFRVGVCLSSITSTTDNGFCSVEPDRTSIRGIISKRGYVLKVQSLVKTLFNDIILLRYTMYQDIIMELRVAIMMMSCYVQALGGSLITTSCPPHYRTYHSFATHNNSTKGGSTQKTMQSHNV